MTAGDYLGMVVLRILWLLHSFLGERVSVANVSDDGGSQLAFALLPGGFGLAREIAVTSEAYVALVYALTEIPLLGTEVAKFLLIVMW